MDPQTLGQLPIFANLRTQLPEALFGAVMLLISKSPLLVSAVTQYNALILAPGQTPADGADYANAIELTETKTSFKTNNFQAPGFQLFLGTNRNTLAHEFGHFLVCGF